jgi:pimeloyl-ACP methyl ester carboxylesterase
MEFMATAVKSLVDSLDLNEVFVVGHSLGGYVTLAFLELFPEYLSGYCLFHSQPFADTPAALEKRRREIEIVKAGKKNMMYPDNVIKMFAPSIKRYCFRDNWRRNNRSSEGDDDKTIEVVFYGRRQNTLFMDIRYDG